MVENYRVILERVMDEFVDPHGFLTSQENLACLEEIGTSDSSQNPPR